MTTEVKWNLSDLYHGADDAKINHDLAEIAKRAERFAIKFRGRVDKLTPGDFGKAVQEYETIVHDLQFPAAYAELLFSADTLTPAHGALMQSVQEKNVAIQQQLLFFELEFIAIPDIQFEQLLAHESAAAYRHFLTQLRASRPHRLSEVEERILLEKSTSGREAFSRLFDEIISSASFSIISNGTSIELSESEILSKLYSSDREERRAAAEGLSSGLQQRARLFTFITNTLAYDKSVDDRMMRYEYPESSRHLSDEVTTETVNMMTDCCVNHFDAVARYYRLKKEILGYDTLYHYDRYAPIVSNDELLSWEEARDTVLTSFSQFSTEIGAMAKRFFDENWIDAEVRTGKRSGAFCAGIAPDWHPYVLTNFLGKQRDVMTIAHELGHGVHDLLASGQKFLHYHPSLAAAETASVFSEMLTFNDLLAKSSSAKQQLSLLTGKIEDIFATVYRQTAMYRFEQALHAARREQGELTTEQINAIWQSELQAMFGDAVEMGDGHECWWMYIPHFIHTPFYVYAYAFGQLMVMALYACYKKEGEDFIPRYLDILRAGGSKPPAEIMADAGIDISQKEFWDGGLMMIAELVTQAEEVWKKVKAEGGM